MLRQIYILLLIGTIGLYVNSFAQTKRYLPETFGTRNGMLSSKIYALTQSNDRKLWIGTELGLSAYDGYDFINYQYTTTNESIGRILCITQDSNNGIWLGGDKGLFYLRENRIEKLKTHNNKILVVEALITDAAGNVWVGDINALYKIPREQSTELVKNNAAKINLLPFASFTKRVFCMDEDNEQNVYIGSYDGIFKIAANTKTIETVWTNASPSQPVRSIAASSPDSIFWNCLDRHPTQMIDGKISSFFTEDFIGREVFTNEHQTFALTTSGVGIMNKGKVQPIVSFGSSTNNAVKALIDAEGNIWVGTWEGLLKFRNTAFQLYTLDKGLNQEVFSFLEKKNGMLLFGGNRGNVFTKKENSITKENTMPALFPLAEVMCMYEDAGGGIWAGSGYQGISRYKNNTLANWKNTKFFEDNNCEALYPVSAGKLFACTENGVTLIDTDAQQPMAAHYPFKDFYSRPPELFGCFQTVNSGYWFYGSQGLFKLSNEQLVRDSIQNMPVTSLYINKIISDKIGNIWIATQGKGLLLCNYESGKLVLKKEYNKSNGLPSDIALSVLADKNGNVWMGDYMSISVLLKPGFEEQLVTFNEKDGLLSSYYQTLKLEQQKNGTIWGLTSMGMVSFHPDSIALNKRSPVLLMNHITVAGTDENFADKYAVTLAYNHNSVQFKYTAISLTDPSKIRYAYRLKELDSNWIFIGSRVVNFNFLQPGNYTFELKACNNNNVWTGTPLQFGFSILPPFWQTWWFRLLLLSLVVFLLSLFYKKRIDNLKAKEAIKQQIAELEGKAIRAQMNPHFIFNSLNAIQETIVTEKIDAAYDYLSRFSKLLRMVLDNSDKNLIPLSTELETLKLYLSLEALRFSQSFSYTIEVNELVDTDDIYIPSLLIQPFAENAIWHGLVHKEGEKLLLISFSESNNRLHCVIEDNGVGRARAAQIKNQKLGAARFESKGTKLAKQRIELLNSQNPGSANIEIIDLFDEGKNATGTKVVFTMANDFANKKVAND